MNLDELQSIRDRERQSDTHQQLRESFYQDVAEFIQNLREERDRAADRADDPFDSPEVNRLTDDIKTAEQTVEAIYERRVGKLVKKASIAAADMPVEDEGLTEEERHLFDSLVDDIEASREHVMAILDGEDPPATDATETGRAPTPAEPDRTPTRDTGGRESPGAADPESTPAAPGPDAQSDAGREPPATGGDPAPEERVDAADLMAGDSPATSPEPDAGGGRSDPGADGSPDDTGRVPVEPDDHPPGSPRAERPTDEHPAAASGSTDEGQGGSPGTASESAPSGDDLRDVGTDEDPVVIDRTTVRITRDVGEIFGVDQRDYDLSAEDVVTLPTENAEPLIERDAAERFD
jgi:DNA replication factor GINS